jgi:hypothetical protein
MYAWILGQAYNKTIEQIEINIYLSSGMFNADTNLYNACLTKYLESKSYNCYLPQRDGLSVAQLSTYLQKHNPEVANEISCYVPYYFDLGKM